MYTLLGPRRHEEPISHAATQAGIDLWHIVSHRGPFPDLSHRMITVSLSVLPKTPLKVPTIITLHLNRIHCLGSDQHGT